MPRVAAANVKPPSDSASDASSTRTNSTASTDRAMPSSQPSVDLEALRPCFRFPSAVLTQHKDSPFRFFLAARRRIPLRGWSALHRQWPLPGARSLSSSERMLWRSRGRFILSVQYRRLITLQDRHEFAQSLPGFMGSTCENVQQFLFGRIHS